MARKFLYLPKNRWEIVLEQDSESGIIMMAEVDPPGSARKGGVNVGNILVAVQNASTENVNL
jgi:predicted metalloprotease with PDZ domain